MVYSKCDQKSSDYCNASLVWFGHGKIDRQWSENIPETMKLEISFIVNSVLGSFQRGLDKFTIDF